MDKFEAEYRAKLTPAQFHILREKGTEPPFSGRYYMTNENGIYHCAAITRCLTANTSFSPPAAGPVLTIRFPATSNSFPTTATVWKEPKLSAPNAALTSGMFFPTGRPTAASATALTPSLWISKTKRIMSFNFPKLRYMRRARLRSESK